MDLKVRRMVTVKVNINAPVAAVWKYWSTPDDIMKWNHASDDWHTTRAVNDLKAGGKFIYRMEAKDGSMGFDFNGIYKKVVIYRKIECVLGDGRKVSVVFNSINDETEIIESFEAEDKHSIELQQNGWQSILKNFKMYVEKNYP